MPSSFRAMKSGFGFPLRCFARCALHIIIIFLIIGGFELHFPNCVHFESLIKNRLKLEHSINFTGITLPLTKIQLSFSMELCTTANPFRLAPLAFCWIAKWLSRIFYVSGHSKRAFISILNVFAWLNALLWLWFNHCCAANWATAHFCAQFCLEITATRNLFISF